MYNFLGYFIDPAEIIIVKKYDTGKSDKRYGLAVKLRNGEEYTTAYAFERRRNDDAISIVNDVDAHRAQMSTLETVRRVVAHEMENTRRDIRELKRLIKTGESGR